MVNINADEHPGLHRYSLELAKYPELSEEQYASVLSDLKQPERSVLYQNARETLICSHLAMILGMAKDTYRKYYGLSMEDYVGLGNMAMVTKFSRFKPGQKVSFAGFYHRPPPRGHVKAAKRRKVAESHFLCRAVLVRTAWSRCENKRKVWGITRILRSTQKYLVTQSICGSTRAKGYSVRTNQA